MGAHSKEFLNDRMDYIDELFESEHNQISKIETLLHRACIEVEEKDSIYREIKDYMTFERAEELINYLYLNQVDPISGGFNYSQSDIIKKQKQ